MATPSISKLGHVGLHVRDIEKEKAFYRDILGLKVTDEDPEMGMVFMSARPEEEHHEFLLCGGRNVGPDARVVQQISFRCETLDDIIGYYRRFKEHAVRFDVILSHGNAVGIYFYDPEGNRCEVYCPTGLKARQPFGLKMDLEQSPTELMAEIRSQVRLYGETGIMRKEDLAAQNIDVPTDAVTALTVTDSREIFSRGETHGSCTASERANLTQQAVCALHRGGLGA